MVVFGWCVMSPSQAQVSVVDDTGATIVLDHPARRIISLAPHVTEMLYAVKAGQFIVGAVDYSDYPEAAKKIPRVGGYDRLDIERILTLKPDLVIAWQSGNPESTIKQLKQLGLTVFLSEPRELEDVAANLEKLGQLAGNETQAVAVATKYRQQLGSLRQQYSTRDRVTVFYQIWDQPLMTINGQQLISKVIDLCGGENVFAKLPTLVPQVSIEAVLLANPEAIVSGGMAAQRPEWIAQWQRWPQLRAVQHGALISIPSDLIQRHSPRVLEGAQLLCTALDRVRLGKR